MKKSLIKFASMILASTMLLSGGIGVSAAEISRATDTEKPISVADTMSGKLLSTQDLSAMIDYATDVLPLYLNGDYDETDNISISHPIKVYNTPMYYVFVLLDNEVIGKLEITKDSGEFFSSFDYGITESVKEIYKNNEEINFVNFNGNIYMYTKNGKSFCVDRSATVKPENAIRFDAPVQKICKSAEVAVKPYTTEKAEIQLDVDSIFAYQVDEEDISVEKPCLCEIRNTNDLILTDKEHMYSEIAAVVSRSSSATANASYVKNVKYNDSWICWAACTAMALNCKQNKSLSASDVASKVAQAGLAIDGSIDCVKASYSLYGYTVNNTVSTAISGSEMMYYLSQNMPVQINIKNDNGKAHAVTVYYVELSQNSVKYKFIDPSRGSTTANKQITYTNLSPSQVTSLFKYTGVDDDGSSVVYTNWYRTYR